MSGEFREDINCKVHEYVDGEFFLHAHGNSSGDLVNELNNMVESKLEKSTAVAMFNYISDISANTDDREFAERLLEVAGDALLCVDEYSHVKWRRIQKLEQRIESLIKAELTALQEADGLESKLEKMESLVESILKRDGGKLGLIAHSYYNNQLKSIKEGE